MKRIVISILLICTLLLSVGCSNKENTKTLKVGILQIIDHPSLDQSRLGFIEELKNNGYEEGVNLEIDYQNAQGDAANLKSMSARLVKDSDLILAIGTPSAQALANETKEVPILFTAITDPVAAGLVDSLDKVGGNISGTSDLSPVKEQISLMLQLKENVKSVGFLYNASEPNSKIIIDMAKKELADKNVEIVEKTIASTNDILQAMQSLVKQVDVIYIPTDNTAAAGMVTVGQVVMEAKVPVVTGSTDMTLEGGLATYGINYNKLGAQTALMAVKIFKNEAKVGELPVEFSNDNLLVVNEDMAKALGIDPTTIKIK